MSFLTPLTTASYPLLQPITSYALSSSKMGLKVLIIDTLFHTILTRVQAYSNPPNDPSQENTKHLYGTNPFSLNNLCFALSAWITKNANQSLSEGQKAATIPVVWLQTLKYLALPPPKLKTYSAIGRAVWGLILRILTWIFVPTRPDGMVHKAKYTYI